MTANSSPFEDRQTGQIVLAEDDATLRNFLSRALKAEGHKVDAFGNGEAALDHLRQQSADLLLTDIVMPGLDGIALSQKAQVLHPGLKTIFITGFAAVQIKLPPTRDLKSLCLSKPFHLRELTREIQRLLRDN